MVWASNHFIFPNSVFVELRGTIVLILIYTTLYSIYGEFTTKGLRLRWSLVPYVVYLIIAILLYICKQPVKCV